ncbi:MAG: META domain-containing protein [Lysobacter sp.]
MPLSPRIAGSILALSVAASPCLAREPERDYRLPETQAGLLQGFFWYPLRATDAKGRPISALRDVRKRGRWWEHTHVRYFDNGSIDKQSPCYSSGGTYSLRDDLIVSGRDGIQTVAGCPGPREVAEDAFFQALSGDLRFQIDTRRSEPLLTLQSEDGARLVLAGEPTPQTRFGGAGTPVTLEVQAERACPRPAPPTQRCLQVREVIDAGNGDALKFGPWRWQSEPIHGYRYQRGMRETVQVLRFDLTTAATGGARIGYGLVRKEGATSLEFIDDARDGL